MRAGLGVVAHSQAEAAPTHIVTLSTIPHAYLQITLNPQHTHTHKKLHPPSSCDSVNSWCLTHPHTRTREGSPVCTHPTQTHHMWLPCVYTHKPHASPDHLIPQTQP